MQTEDGTNWKKKTILLLDNATYHRSKVLMKLINNVGIPTMFLAPYTPMLAPVELVFAHLKKGELNPESIPIGKK